MKRTGFKRKQVPTFKKRTVGLRRTTKLRVKGHSTSGQLKDEIQALLRQIVMKRDKGCILRMERECGGELDSGAVLQADHLITRSNSATFADERLVVCLCRSCHGWKSLGNNLRKAQYDALIKEILPEVRVKLWEKCERDSWRPSAKRSYDWSLEIVRLKQLARSMGIEV